MGATTWTPDQTEMALRLRLQGRTMAEIAEHVGCTREAVIGRLWRLRGCDTRTRKRQAEERFLTDTLDRVSLESAYMAGRKSYEPHSQSCRKDFGKGQHCGHRRLPGYAFCEAHLREYRELVGRGA